jgi:hypothetical protein
MAMLSSAGTMVSIVAVQQHTWFCLFACLQLPELGHLVSHAAAALVFYSLSIPAVCLSTCPVPSTLAYNVSDVAAVLLNAAALAVLYISTVRQQ